MALFASETVPSIISFLHGLQAWPAAISICDTEPHCTCGPWGGEKHQASMCLILNVQSCGLRLTLVLACFGAASEVVWRVGKGWNKSTKACAELCISSFSSLWAGFCLPGGSTWRKVEKGGGRSICPGKKLSPCASLMPGGCHLLHHLRGSIFTFFVCLHADIKLLLSTSSSTPSKGIPPNRSRQKSSSQKKIPKCKQQNTCRNRKKKKTPKDNTNTDQLASRVGQGLSG